MKIDLGSGYRIVALDPMNWGLQRLTTAGASGRGLHLVKFAGRKSWVTVGYHGTLEQAALSGLDKIRKARPEVTSLDQALEVLRETARQVADACRAALEADRAA